MEENKKRKSIGRFFIKMFLIFTILDVFMMEFANIIVSNTSFYKYGEDLLWEVFYAILVLVVMLLFHNSYVFTDKK